MKITKITTMVVNAKMRNWVVVQVYTDVPGLIGIGEATVEYQARAVVGAVEDLAPTLIGRDPRDIESLPFLEAARQIRQDVGRDNVFYLHVSLVPYMGPAGELKTKPTQHSVSALRSIGITPDAIVLRSDRQIPDSVKKKISLMCDVEIEGVVAAVDAPSIYDIPKVLYSEGLDAYVVKRLGVKATDVVWGEWEDLLDKVHNPKHQVTVALVGKYIDLPDAYLSVTEALRAGGFANHVESDQLREYLEMKKLIIKGQQTKLLLKLVHALKNQQCSSKSVYQLLPLLRM